MSPHVKQAQKKVRQPQKYCGNHTEMFPQCILYIHYIQQGSPTVTGAGSDLFWMDTLGPDTQINLNILFCLTILLDFYFGPNTQL